MISKFVSSLYDICDFSILSDKRHPAISIALSFFTNFILLKNPLVFVFAANLY